MYVFLLILLFLTCAHVDESQEQVSYSKVDDEILMETVKVIDNLDSLICSFIKKTEHFQLIQTSYDLLSFKQQEELSVCARYADVNLEIVADRKETKTKHSDRLSICVYDKYFDRLEQGDLALEVIVSTSEYTGKKHLYLLKGNTADSTYTIAYLIGSSKL